MSSVDDIVNRIATDRDLVRRVSGWTQLEQSAVEGYRLLLMLDLAHRFERSPEIYSAIALEYLRTAKRASERMIREGWHQQFVETLLPIFDGLQFSQHAPEIERLPGVLVPFDALGITREKRDPMWALVDGEVARAGLPDVVATWEARLLRNAVFFEDVIGDDWEHLSPFNWRQKAGDVFIHLGRATVAGGLAVILTGGGAPAGAPAVAGGATLIIIGVAIKP